MSLDVIVAPEFEAEAGRVSVVSADGRGAGRPGGGSDRAAFAEAVRVGLSARPRTLPCRYFYDEAGSALFEQICRLPEYYLTRTEDALLAAHAPAMTAGWPPAGPPTLIELGSGSGEKTRRLIAALLDRHGRLHYVPIDVSASALGASARDLARAFPSLRVTGYVGDYLASLGAIAGRLRGPKLVAFLGSSLGNYEPAAAAALLAAVARVMGPDDRLLLGTDMAKGAAVLEPAYDDARGVTARFNLNLLVRINRELGADFDPARWRHRASYRPDRGRVEMHLESLDDQAVTVPAAGVSVRFARGETIHTENSHKYTSESLRALADRGGFAEEAAWSDPRGWFRVQRWAPRP